MQALLSTMIPYRLRMAQKLIQLWPFNRGQMRIARILLPRSSTWPKTASFRFRYGVFMNTPLGPWPHGYRELFIFGVVERVEVEMWRRVLRNGDTVVDGGANYGYWTLVASAL